MCVCVCVSVPSTPAGTSRSRSTSTSLEWNKATAGVLSRAESTRARRRTRRQYPPVPGGVLAGTSTSRIASAASAALSAIAWFHAFASGEGQVRKENGIGFACLGGG